MKTVVVTSPATDAGKTFIACNLAVAAAGLGVPAALLDFDLAVGDMVRALGMEEEARRPHPTVASWRDYRDPVAAALRGPGGVAVFPCPENPVEEIDRDSIEALFRVLSPTFRAVVVDAGADVGAGHWRTLVDAADEILLVADCDEKALYRIKRFLSVYGRSITGKCRLVVNQREAAQRYLPRDVWKALAGEEAAFISVTEVPHDRKIAAGKRRLALADPDGAAARAIRGLAADLFGISLREAGEAGKGVPLLRKFFSGRAAPQSGPPAPSTPDARTAPPTAAPASGAETEHTGTAPHRRVFEGKILVCLGAPRLEAWLVDRLTAQRIEAAVVGPAGLGSARKGDVLVVSRASVEAVAGPRSAGAKVVLILGQSTPDEAARYEADRVVWWPQGSKFRAEDLLGEVLSVCRGDRPAEVHGPGTTGRPEAPEEPAQTERAKDEGSGRGTEGQTPEALAADLGAEAGREPTAGSGTSVGPEPASGRGSSAPVRGGVLVLADQSVVALLRSAGFRLVSDPREAAACVCDVPRAAFAPPGVPVLVLRTGSVSDLSAVMARPGAVLVDAEEVAERLLAVLARHGAAAEGSPVPTGYARSGGAADARGHRISDAREGAAGGLGASPGGGPAAREEGDRGAAVPPPADAAGDRQVRTEDAGSHPRRPNLFVIPGHRAGGGVAVPEHGAVFVVCPGEPPMAGRVAARLAAEIPGSALVCATGSSTAALALGMRPEDLVLRDWRIPGADAPVEFGGVTVWPVDPGKFLEARDAPVHGLVGQIRGRFPLVVVDCGGDLSVCTAAPRDAAILIIRTGDSLARWAVEQWTKSYSGNVLVLERGEVPVLEHVGNGFALRAGKLGDSVQSDVGA